MNIRVGGGRPNPGAQRTAGNRIRAARSWRVSDNAMVDAFREISEIPQSRVGRGSTLTAGFPGNPRPRRLRTRRVGSLLSRWRASNIRPMGRRREALC
jgi:hypothetical protein